MHKSTLNMIIIMYNCLCACLHVQGHGDYSSPADKYGQPFTPQPHDEFSHPFIPRPRDQFGEPFIPQPGDEFGEPLDDTDYGNHSALNSLTGSLATQLRSHADHFGFPDTDTSVIEDSLNSWEGTGDYSMGPVLKAMLEEWNMGEELLSKKKRRRKISQEQQLQSDY